MKNIRLYRTKKNNAAILPEKRLFPSFHFKVFLAKISSSKILRHLIKDTEFCHIFQISEKLLLRHFPYFLVFGSSQSNNWEVLWLIAYALPALFGFAEYHFFRQVEL